MLGGVITTRATAFRSSSLTETIPSAMSSIILPRNIKSHVRQKMRSAYAMRDHSDAKRALDRLLRELMDLNPSAARSLEEGREDSHGT